MKFFIINSFRLMVYIAYIVIIAAGVFMGYYNGFVLEQSSVELLRVGLEGPTAQFLTLIGLSFLGWVAASLICGLIVTFLDIRDDINDRLPDARRDD